MNSALYAQNSIDFTVKNNFIWKPKTIAFDSSRFIFSSEASIIRCSKQTISPDFSTCNYGFFCKEELKLEKAARLAIRIRLGSLQECNYYEGKR